MMAASNRSSSATVLSKRRSASRFVVCDFIVSILTHPNWNPSASKADSACSYVTSTTCSNVLVSEESLNVEMDPRHAATLLTSLQMTVGGARARTVLGAWDAFETSKEIGVKALSSGTRVHGFSNTVCLTSVPSFALYVRNFELSNKSLDKVSSALSPSATAYCWKSNCSNKEDDVRIEIPRTVSWLPRGTWPIKMVSVSTGDHSFLNF
mmetsp:Transcript_126000/g.218341  ORF Transcript_126000/g.218341 Transcript_126000/m.218341 type:complete len:209 (+) Transcript_126000:74-700(+)